MWLSIPCDFFADFLRGCIDGDGNIDVFKHPESRHLQLRIRLSSASLEFLLWVGSEISKILKRKSGWVEHFNSVYILTYGKSDSVALFKFMYYGGVEFYLERKYKKAEPFLRV